MLKSISDAVDLCEKYPSSALILQLDSLVQVEETDGLAFQRGPSYRVARQQLMNYVCDIIERRCVVNYDEKGPPSLDRRQFWVIAISDHPLVTSRFKDRLGWESPPLNLAGKSKWICHFDGVSCEGEPEEQEEDVNNKCRYHADKFEPDLYIKLTYFYSNSDHKEATILETIEALSAGHSHVQRNEKLKEIASKYRQSHPKLLHEIVWGCCGQRGLRAPGCEERRKHLPLKEESKARANEPK